MCNSSDAFRPKFVVLVSVIKQGSSHAVVPRLACQVPHGPGIARGDRPHLRARKIRVAVQFDDETLKTPQLASDEYQMLQIPSQIQHLDMRTANVLASDRATMSLGGDLLRKLQLVMIPLTN